MTRLAAVKWIPLPTFVDPRGTLTAFEANVDAPFSIQRIFYMYDVKPPFERGGHAHVHAEHVLVCVAGTMKLDLSDPASTATYVLDSPAKGLYVPSMVWTHLYEFTPETVCLAAASNLYKDNEVIRSWDEYVRLANSTASIAAENR
jgi:hypothetical protein